MANQKDPPFLEVLDPKNMPLPWMEWFRQCTYNLNLNITIKVGFGAGSVPIFDSEGNLDDSEIPADQIVTLTGAQTLTNKTLTNPILAGLAAGLPLELDSNLIPVNVYGHVATKVNHSADATLTISDLRKAHIVDCSGGDRVLTLPSVSASNIGEWVVFGRTGNNRLQLFAADSDYIVDSSAGGSIESRDTTYNYQLLGLRLLEADRWWFGPENFGIWVTR